VINQALWPSRFSDLREEELWSVKAGELMKSYGIGEVEQSAMPFGTSFAGSSVYLRLLSRSIVLNIAGV
jgi:hypothetical protein